MNLSDHDLLARNLSAWAGEIIEHGRSPFRKVETWPALISAEGEVHPPLVLWINRASLMAGGIILFLQDELDATLVTGQACARALGLRHFVIWTDEEVSFWEDAAGRPQRIKKLSISPSRNPSEAELRDCLVETLDELKLLAVIGALPPQQLGAYYLANLCRVPLDFSLSEMTTALRRARAERTSSGGRESEEYQARRKGALTLLRLLVLTAYNHLPEAVQPEKLERAMELALPYLSAPLAELLAFSEETPLDHASAVRFHHLFRRLSQLKWGSDRETAAATVALLIDNEGGYWGAAPLPATPPADRPLLLVNAGSSEGLSPAQLYETADTPILLAAGAFLRELRGKPAARISRADPTSLNELPQPYAALVGTLNPSEPPDAGERERLRILLRNSWPMRRFSLSARTPRWVWELVHLVGLADEAAQIHLRLPGDWVNADYGQPLYEFLCEQTSLLRLKRCGPGTLTLHLRKGCTPETLTRLQGADAEERKLSWQQLCAAPLSYLALCLDLPPQIYRLLQDQQLRLPAEQYGPTEVRGAALFVRSSLGQYLWRIATGGENLPSDRKAAQRWTEEKIPLPAREVLTMLSESEAHDDAQIDAQLQRLLGFDPGLIPSDDSRMRPGRRRRRGISPAETEKMLKALLRDGRPRFPEQYLYDYFRPELKSYKLEGPLVGKDEFLGTFDLRDEKGHVLQVEGEETARALILASHSAPGSIELPVDRHLTAEILARYLSDLRDLRRGFLREAHARVGEARPARKLARRLWDSLELPPWELLEE